MRYWRDDKAFKMLCDAVATNNLICFTGAGISKELELKNGNKAQDWYGLLNNIKEVLEKSYPTSLKEFDEEINDLNNLLCENAVGEQLIEASSILYKINSYEFEKIFKDSVDLKKGQTSETHRKILNLYPRGIITYNYDEAHENSFTENTEYRNFKLLTSENEQEICDLIKNNLNEFFLFKAHGTVDGEKILTSETYRNLFNKYPYYKTFMQHIFTNYQFLIIGFGLSDPDFDMLLQNVFNTFGSPLQNHIIIEDISKINPKHIIYRRRYGLNFLYVKTYSDIPKVLEDAANDNNSDILSNIIKLSISNNIKDRGKAHSLIRNLSIVGIRCIEKIIKNMINNTSDVDQKEYRYSELVYTYGVIINAIKSKKNKDYQEGKKFLMNIVENCNYSEPVAHALVQLRDMLEESDISKVENWINVFEYKSFEYDPNNVDKDNRVYHYCVTIYYLLRAKYKP